MTAALPYATFIAAHTEIISPPLVPELRLHLASEITPLWEATEAHLAEAGVNPPYWAFCWPGGQALTRWILDQPDRFPGRRVLDFASGCGVAGIAAARLGARVEANDIDEVAATAIAMNAALNGVAIDINQHDLIGIADRDWDVVLAGDVFYERPLADRLWPWLRHLAGKGTTVLIGDPGRSYLPDVGMCPLAGYSVLTSVDLEDREVRDTTVWQVCAR